MSLDQKDFEQLERVIYKNGDDVAVSISRSFVRLEERLDVLEARSCGRLADIEDKIDRLAEVDDDLAKEEEPED